MRSVVETVNAEPCRIASLAIRPVAEHSGAEKRRKIDIVVFVRQMETISRVGEGEVGVAAVDVIAGKLCAIAKIFSVRSTIRAFAVGPAEPWNADAVSD